MSYILDALNRADAERERGAAPGLHTRHQVPADNTEGPVARRRLWLAVAVGMVLLMLGLGVWFWRSPGSAPAAPLPPAAIATPIAPTPMAPVAAPAAPTGPVTALVPMPDAPPPKPTPNAAPGTAQAATSAASKPATPAHTATSTPVPPATVSAVAPAAPVAAPLLGELPSALRSQIPKITITGSVYSDSPAHRLLLVNNLVLSQGAQITPDLNVEEIQPRSSVFNFKGTRFRVMH